MPFFNAELYLREAIQSILNQSHRSLELILLDDFSTDNSLKIAESYSDRRIKLIRNSKNIGLTKSLNKALKSVNGKYIARMDADDISLPTRFEKQVSFLEKNLDIDIVGSWVKYLPSEDILKLPTDDDSIKVSLLKYSSLVHPAVMIRTLSFEKHGIRYDEGFSSGQDYNLWVSNIETLRYSNLDEVLLLLRIHENQISNRLRSTQTENTILIKKKIFKKLGVKTESEFGKLACLFNAEISIGDKKEDFDLLDKLQDNNIVLSVFNQRVFNKYIDAVKREYNERYYFNRYVKEGKNNFMKLANLYLNLFPAIHYLTFRQLILIHAKCILHT
jgi:glycosyltransferase involved in cell wall biosynthesis